METIPTVVFVEYTNVSYPEPQESYYRWCKTPRFTVLIIAWVCACICVCGLVGNAVVLWFLGFRMKQNPFTVYVLNLAIADFSMLLALAAKLTLYIITSISCIEYVVFFLSNDILFILFQVCYLAGMYLLTAMSVERCLAALFPVWYRCHRSKHCSAMMCGLLWTLAIIFVASVFLPLVHHREKYHILYFFSIVNFVLFCFIPLLSNLVLFIKLRCGSQRRHPGKLYVAVLLSVLFLVVLGLPFSVESVLLHHRAHLFYISFLLAALNSSVNPVIYFLVGSCRQHQFQCSLKVAFRRLFEEGAMNEERSQVPKDTVMETSV